MGLLKNLNFIDIYLFFALATIFHKYNFKKYIMEEKKFI